MERSDCIFTRLVFGESETGLHNLESFPNLRQVLIGFVAILWLFYGYVFLRSREIQEKLFFTATD